MMCPKKCKSILIALLFGFLVPNVWAQKPADYAIIPKPNSIEMNQGFFKLNSKTTIASANSNAKSDAQLFIQSVEEIFGLKLSFFDEPTKINYIRLIYNPKFETDEYHLTVTPSNIEIVGGTNGVFYGLQTLLQLVKSDTANTLTVACCKISDKPRFSWRGLHLDVSRHFFSVETVKKYLDRMAFYKLNTFHWHLTDDQGWRIEIKKYPLLTQIGAWRKGTVIGHAAYSKQFDTISYGGFYTQTEIKEIVDYASQRHITIVPEIEMPGHAVAALTAYPQFSCKGSVGGVEKNWGVFEDVFCTREETFHFIQDILDEVVDLFPSKIIHIGGDECPKEAWKKCEICQANIKALRLKNEMELQSYFVQRIEKYLKSKGRTIIGWDEILEGGLAPNAMVMSWRGTEGGIAAANLKHHVVMTPGAYCYFDHYQSDVDDEPLAIGGFTTVKKIYGYDPAPLSLSKNVRKYINGVQANMWTEYIPNAAHLEYMLFPRLLPMAEIQWTQPENKNFNNFALRLKHHYFLFHRLGINASMSVFDTQYKISQNADSSGVILSLSCEMPDANIKVVKIAKSAEPIQFYYAKEFAVDTTAVLKISATSDNYQGKTKVLMFNINKATGKPIAFETIPTKWFGDTAGLCLVDGLSSVSHLDNSQWMTWVDTNAAFIIDLKKSIDFNRISVCTFSDLPRQILKASSYQVYTSNNGIDFDKVEITLNKSDNEIDFISLVKPVNGRFVKIVASKNEKIIDPISKKEVSSWIFIGEIGVE